MDVNIKVTADVNLEKYQRLTEIATMALANEVMASLKIDIPRPPSPGSMQFKSERQRRFVMASIKRGTITVPYVRGSSKTVGSAHLQASYRIANEGGTAVLYSAAPYVQYVIGDQQAQIHQGRWKTAKMAVEDVMQSGVLDDIVAKAIAEMEM